MTIAKQTAGLWAAVLSVWIASPATVQAVPQPTCYGDPLVLACFKSYKTDLRSQHNKQLDAVVERVLASQKSSVPSDYISVVGHSATFGNNAYVEKNAKERAHNVAVRLAQKLKQRGLKGIKIEEVALSDSQPRVSNGNQEGRALNRRVEIILSDTRSVEGIKKAHKELCTQKGQRSKTVTVKTEVQCNSIPQGDKICKERLNFGSKKKFQGSICHPHKVFCVMCLR